MTNKKLYVLIFTCAVIRAVHLELTDSMNIDDFMLALRRLFSRGIASAIYSDNAKTFIACSDRLLKLLGPNCPKFIRINPLSPWWGGWWERLVKSCKMGLRKSIGRHLLLRKELETHLVEVEAHINSRPLTEVGDGLDSLTPLTPAHFLIGRSFGLKTLVDLEEQAITSGDLSDREKHRLQRMNVFWSVWSKNYLCNLPPAVNKFKTKGHLEKGSVVLIKQDKQPRLTWPLGVVEELYPGRDGLCRSVKLRTAKGTVIRSIQLLYNLEVQNSSTLAPSVGDSRKNKSDSKVSMETGNSVESKSSMDGISGNDLRLRYGRVVKR